MTDVLIVGGGVAGLTVAKELARDGIRSVIVEKGDRPGGRTSLISHVFPSKVSGHQIIAELSSKIDRDMVDILTSSTVVRISRDDVAFLAEVNSGENELTVRSKAVVLATGLEPIDASIIREFGLGRFADVITSLDLEMMLSSGKVKRPSDGSIPRTVVFVQCVGSRVERRGVRYCSNICCMNAIKNSSLIREMHPGTRCFVLYIDIRTHGKGYEDAYKEARRKGVVFIRGQPSMVLQKDSSLSVCGENTLLKELYEIEADLVVLSVGLRTSKEERTLFSSCGVGMDRDGLPLTSDEIMAISTSRADGIFLAGSMEAPKDIRDTISHARCSAADVRRYLGK